MMATQQRDWYPSISQLKDPDSLHQVMQQILTQHYALRDQMKTVAAPVKSAAPAASDTPAGTKFLGLNVQPIDTQTLPDGAMVKFDKKAGAFKVSL